MNNEEQIELIELEAQAIVWWGRQWLRFRVAELQKYALELGVIRDSLSCYQQAYTDLFNEVAFED